MNFHGSALRLTDLDIPRIGASIGVGEDEIHAVLDVETRGGGFDRDGRPKMLFEPHVFYRELGPGPTRDAAVRQGLAYRRWGAAKYPRDSYPRLIAAMLIDRHAALRAASWGIGQVMGFNAVAAGFETARDMVTAFLDSEAAQLAGMVEFIRASGLDDDLRRHDWAGFAKGYNGAAYARHGYAKHLAARFAFWRSKPDTPFEIARAEIDPNAPLATLTA